jgi:hypothetical protein
VIQALATNHDDERYQHNLKVDTDIQAGITCPGDTHCYVVAANRVLAHHPILRYAARTWNQHHDDPQFPARVPKDERVGWCRIMHYQHQLRQPNHVITLRHIQSLALSMAIVNHTDSMFGCGEQHDCSEFLYAMLLLLFRVVHRFDPTNEGVTGKLGVIIWNYSAGQHWSVDHKWSLSFPATQSANNPPMTLDALMRLDVNQNKAHFRLQGLGNTPAVLLFDINACHLPTGYQSPIKHTQPIIPPDHLSLTSSDGQVLIYTLRTVVWHQGRDFKSGHYMAEVVHQSAVWVDQQGEWRPASVHQPSSLQQIRRHPRSFQDGTTVKLLLYCLDPEHQLTVAPH